MQITAGGKKYELSNEILINRETRESYFTLARETFGLDFNKWYESGFWGGSFVPYVIFDGKRAVSSAAACVQETYRRGEKKICVQLSTVMTSPEYRRLGLNRLLIEKILSDLENKCDVIFLFGNDSVADYYPKFGFERFTEYEFNVPVTRNPGKKRKMDLKDKAEVRLLLDKYAGANPFAEYRVNDPGTFMFHCLTFYPDDVYYFEKFGAAVIVKYDKNKMTVAEILAPPRFSLREILSALADGETETAYLGFTPPPSYENFAKESEEGDNHPFVLSKKENIFKGEKIKVPLTSRA